MRKIIILRHGKTEWNDLGKIQGKLTLYYPQKGEIKFPSGNYRQNIKMPNGYVVHLSALYRLPVSLA